MALRKIVQRGDEILTKVCKPVKEITPRIEELCHDMVDTMNEADGVGLAAPQVGVMKRLFVARPFVDDEDESIRDTVFYMINPEITHREGSQPSGEGCLSVPGYMGLVDRPQKIRIKFTDLDGSQKELEFEDFPATVMCHEYDHLDGILYCDIAEDFMTTEEYYARLEKLKEEHEEEVDE